MDDYDSWLAQSTNTDEIARKIDRILEETFPNPYEEDYCYIECPNCGKRLYEGDLYYPELSVCESCLDDYRQYVNLE